MAKFTWFSTYSVNHEVIDNHHKRIIDLFNRIYDCLPDANNQIYEETLDELIYYTGYHFDTEKQYMEEMNYDGMESHLCEHQKFAARLAALKNRTDNFSEEAFKELVCSLGYWVLNHETEKDLEMVKALNRDKAQ